MRRKIKDIMGKITLMGLLGLSLSCSSNVESNTWTIRNNKVKADYEYTIIKEEDFDRLLKQYKTTNKYCLMTYTDAIEMEKDVDVVSGKQPNFDKGEHYYAIAKIKYHDKDLTEKEKSMIALLGAPNALIYGNSSTGNMGIVFMSSYGGMIPDAIDVSSSEYTRKYNQLVGFVNGDNN